ncbi:hypothetical protein [Flavobacterium sp.]|uniref:hypothetical protein n=1 Tax=Flavobacterium sp. TaxID=239 RepID=UPI003752A728
MDNNLEFKTIIKRSFLDNSKRQLIINSDYIQFEDKDLATDYFTKFLSSEIKDYRYGVRWIRGAKFTIGRDYQIFIRNNENKIIKINFKSFYGINKSLHFKNYSGILNSLLKFYFNKIASDFIEKFQNQLEFSICNVHFSDKNIMIETNSIIKKKQNTILWKDVRTKDYRTYFAIYSQENPANINQCYNYKDDWNTAILNTVIRTILKNKE